MGSSPFRGGILRYADKWGLAKVYDKLVDLEKTYGVHFRTADMIKEMAATGKKFYNN